ncbi:MAG TPA: hypothetical protein VGS22_24565 [Thermoanaerobaculia bacterium]|jgi:hypothetical protein|nr:hypothetical protein [Thermoanaerobaculia bacterium]
MHILKRAGDAFFIAPFDGRSHFLFDIFQGHLVDVCAEFGRHVNLVRVDEQEEPDQVAAIKIGLNGAMFAVCDLTPGGSIELPVWNPNVFYELGIAEQLGLPTFLTCDEKRRPTKTTAPLPFDIAHKAVAFYSFSPAGLTELGNKFRSWVVREMDQNSGRIRAYEQSQYFVQSAREIKERLYTWRGPWAPSFRQLLARIMAPLNNQAAEMTSFIQEKRGPTYSFQPPKRSGAIEQLFVAMIESLEKGDEYHTLSTIQFWRSFENDGALFREACRRAANRGVLVRRLLIVPEGADKDEERIVRGHLSVRNSTPENYDLRVLKLPRDQAQRPLGHVGVCKRNGIGVTTAFEPVYDEESRPPRVKAIRLRNDADDAVREFEERWREVQIYDTSG